MITTHAMIKTQKTFYKNIYLSLYYKGSKRITQSLRVRGAGDRTETAIFDLHSYGRQRCVFLVLLMLNQRSIGPLCGWWLPLLHLISNFSGAQTPSGFPRAPSAGVVLPTTSRLSPYYNSTATPTVLTSVLTELYNSSTPTWSPSRSLKSDV